MNWTYSTLVYGVNYVRPYTKEGVGITHFEANYYTLPIYVTDAQRKAIANMASKEDHQVVRAMFESLGSRKMATLPTNSYVPVEQKVSVAPQIKQQFVNFGSLSRKFQ